MSTNTSTPQQEANYLEDDDAVNTEEASNPTKLEFHEQDTSIQHDSPSDLQTQPQEELAMIQEEEEEEEEEKVEEQPDPADQSTLVFNSKESEEEPFNTTVDTT